MVNRNLPIVDFVNNGKLYIETYFLVLLFSAVCRFVLCHTVAKKDEFLVNLFQGLAVKNITTNEQGLAMVGL
jgi:hypothetical protein